MKIVKKFFLTGLLCLLAVCVFAQTQDFQIIFSRFLLMAI